MAGKKAKTLLCVAPKVGIGKVAESNPLQAKEKEGTQAMDTDKATTIRLKRLLITLICLNPVDLARATLAGLPTVYVESTRIIRKKGFCLNGVATLLLLAAALMAAWPGCPAGTAGGPAGSVASQESRPSGTITEKIGVIEPPGTAAQSLPAPDGAVPQPRSGRTPKAAGTPRQAGPDTSPDLLPAPITQVVDGGRLWALRKRP